MNGLRRASTFGIDYTVACLAEVEGCGINQKDSMGYTPLAWAAMNGHEAVVKLLLSRTNINPDKPGEDGRTPLLLASSNGQDGAVKMLLERDDVNPNYADENSHTPLLLAACNGREGVVKMLLGRDECQPQLLGCGRLHTSLAGCLLWV